MKTKPGRRERKREATRQQIVAAAAALFGEKEYDSVTVDEIAERADVVKGTLYAHFPAKEDVASAVHAVSVETVTTEIAERIGNGESAIGLLGQLLADVALRSEGNRRLARTVYSHGMSQAWSQTHDSESAFDFASVVEQIITYGQRTGELKRDAPSRELAVMVSVLFATTVWLWATETSGDPLQDRVRRCFNFALNGISGHSAEPQVIG